MREFDRGFTQGGLRLPMWRAWFDQYSGKTLGITTRRQHGRRGVARVKTYGDVLDEYRHHPESKCADAAGASCGKQTTCLLQQRIESARRS